MLDDIATVDVDTSNNEAGDGATTEDVTNSGADTPAQTDDKDYRSLYENQKVRAEKAEAALKAKSDNQPFDPEAIRKEAEAAALRTIDQRFLDEQELPDEIKQEVETLAQVKGISLREAAQHGYIKAQVEEHKRQVRVAAASPDASGGAAPGYTFDPDNPPDVDVSTPEGQEAIEKWEKELERSKR